MDKGFSLIEYLLVIAILGSIILLIANIPNSMMLINKSKHLSIAREIAVKQIEDQRSLNYLNITLGQSPFDDPRLGLLPQGNGTIVIGVKNEATEDPDDWIGCDVSICQNGEDLKQVSITVHWVDNNKPQATKLDALIGEGGINQ